MYNLPDLPAPKTELIFSEKAKSLWLQALKRPTVEMRSRAAQTIALAHRRGMKGLEDTIDLLIGLIDNAAEHSAVRLEAVKAVIELDARGAAAKLFSVAQTGSSELREVIEPVLARWDHKPAREMWLERLREPSMSGRSLFLAVTSLAAVREKRAADGFRQLALGDRSPSIRVEAGRGLGLLRDEGLEKDAERLAGDDSVLGISARLAAGLMLQQHKSEEAVRILQRLTKDREPAVAAVAVARLIQIDPKLALGQLDHLLASPDEKLRSYGVDVLREVPGEKHVQLLGERLDDLHPDVRARARRALYELAVKKGLRDQVLAAGTKMLATDKWRGEEQAAILLSDLDHRPAAKRLLQLLPAERSEVFVTAAWALRRLAVKESLPGVVGYLKSELPLFRSRRNRGERPNASHHLVDHQLSQLNQLLGQQKYREADTILQGFIPRMTNAMSFESRAAAIWALGLIHEGKRNATLEKAVTARLQDTATQPPEDPRVRRMSAILLGRVGAKDAVPKLKKYSIRFEQTGDPVNDACNWSIARLTGVKLPAPKTIRKPATGWFISPR
jgi:HEAT repeat protein